MNWKQYQEQTAKFFRTLGCEAAVEVTVKGARAKHTIDVWVRFNKFGLETTWVVECKCWTSPVTKEKVLALKSVVEDVGADRGILISTAGFQSGAVHASEKTNITLTSLDELKETAQEDLVASALHGLETKLVELKYALFALYSTKRTGKHSSELSPRPGVDGAAVARTIGNLSVLEHGFDGVRISKPPYKVRFDDSGQAIVSVETLDKFVVQASKVIGEAELTLRANSPLV